MKLLVTGGLGFIGSNFIRHHLVHFPQDRILNLDKITYAGNPENLRDVERNVHYRFHQGDIADRSCVKKIFDEFRPEIVVNFAAESHVDRSILDSEDFIRTNVVGIQVLLDQAKTSGVKRFMQVSTDEVYGSLGPSGFFTEKSPLHPNNPYSASKAAGDFLCLSYHKTFGMPVLISRSSNNYGPFQFPEKLIPLMIQNALEDKPLPLYGDGKNVRDWIHVDDHCRAIETIIKEGELGEVYNIGAENESDNLSLVKKILDQIQKPHSLIRFVKDRPGHDLRYATDASKLKSLGWRPLISFEEGLGLTLSWYQDHRDWISNITDGNYRNYLQVQYGGR